MNQLPSVLLLAVPLALGAHAEDQLPQHLRPYDDGMLEAGDFRAAVPDPRPEADGLRLMALTWTEIRYEFRYRISASTPTTLSLESIEFQALFDRSKSWNSEKSNRELLDHEQGHFDLAAIHALRLQLAFEKRLRDGRGITVEGSEQQAVPGMRREIDREFQSTLDALTNANQEYDEVTSHGIKGVEQEQERQKHAAQLMRAIEELRELREK